MTVSKGAGYLSPVYSSAVSQPVLDKRSYLSIGFSVGILSVVVGSASPAQAAIQDSVYFGAPQTAKEPVSDSVEVVEPADFFPSTQDPVDREATSQENRLRELQQAAQRSRQAWDQWEQQQLEKARLEQIRLERLQQEQALPSQLSESAPYAADGVYLYGQQPIANQPATTYFVFEAQAGSVTGALYMASSSFDCVQGQMTSDRITLNVTNSYSQETYAYALALNDVSAEVAGRLNVSIPPTIDGFHQLSVSEQDRAILAICQTQL